MKKILVGVLALFWVLGCKEYKPATPKKENRFPIALDSVFEKHGGLEAWKKLKQYSFQIKNEVHTVDLHSRKSLITANNYAIGFDGANVWLTQKDSVSFKGNKDFYYNLYFYFNAMPFVLADDGIVYENAVPLVFEGLSYPGIKISFKANVGASPDDNYYMYYHPTSHKMEWLQYSVTFFSKKASNKVNTIRYEDWTTVNGVLMPSKLTWYKKDAAGNISEPARASTLILNHQLSAQAVDEQIFYKTNE